MKLHTLTTPLSVSIWAHDVIPANSVRLAPGTHHEWIIESKDGDNVDTLLTELGQVLDISWHVADGTGRGESTLIYTLAFCL